jgi:putative oxidoreductase
MINKRLGLPVGDFATTYALVAHFVGGVMLILGIFTRWAAMANLPILMAAVLLFHFDQGFFLRGVITDVARGKAGVAGYEYALFVLAATLAQCFLGAGALGLTKS